MREKGKEEIVGKGRKQGREEEKWIKGKEGSEKGRKEVKKGRHEISEAKVHRP